MKRLRSSPELPMCMRFSSLDERGRFYSKEFRTGMLRAWLGARENTVFAMILGRYTRTFPREYARIWKNTVVIDDYRGLSDLKEYFVQYRPESVYYDRNMYADRSACARCGRAYSDCWECDGFLGQELAFDLDVENLSCPLHGDLDQRVRRGDTASFCEHDLELLKERTVDLLDELRGSYRKLRAVYSGRGYHLHVLDRKATRMSREERKELAEGLAEDFPIDEWVTEGESHLIRLPYSLNALVTRVVTPLDLQEIPEFDPVTDRRCIPGFASRPDTRRIP